MLTWQLLQVAVACAPVSAKPVVAWLKVAPAHDVVLWHIEQSVGKPAAAWLGFVAVL